MSTSLISELKQKYQGKKVLVVGLGLQGGGVGIARFFSEIGSVVTVTDKKDEVKLAPSVAALNGLKVKFRLGGHDVSDFIGADVIFKGPGVLWTAPEIVAAMEKGIPVEMEMSFVAANFPGRMIGITGTRGKSTTTNLIFNVLKDQGLPVHLGGGLPGISNIEYLKKLGSKDYLVAELSSWALSGFHSKKISPHFAVFTNIFPDHLNYYPKMEDYLYDKKAIFAYQKNGDVVVINKSLEKEATGIPSRVVTFKAADFPQTLKYLKGVHNLENAAAALKVAEALSLDRNMAVDTIKNFSGLPYRQQIVGKKNSVVFINDTTSTTPVATIRAIDSFSDGSIYLLLGGNSKNLPCQELLDKLSNVKKIILLAGSFTDEIMHALNEKYSEKLTTVYDNLEGAVKKAYEEAANDKNPLSYVLFSPGATSFAMFNNEFHRGDEFNRQVNILISDVKQTFC